VVGVRDWRFNQHIEDIEWLLKLQSADGSASTGAHSPSNSSGSSSSVMVSKSSSSSRKLWFNRQGMLHSWFACLHLQQCGTLLQARSPAPTSVQA
jgi:hypothetical protein